MHKRGALWALAALALGILSCGYVIGNRSVSTEERPLQGFTSISTGGSGTLTVHRGDFKVQVTADSNILPAITTEVVGGELRIGVKPGTVIANPTKLAYEITLPELRGLRIGGSGSAQVDPFSGDHLEVRLSGSGRLSGRFAYDEASYEVLGSGGAEVRGGGALVRVSTIGSGSFYLDGSVGRLEVSSTGSGGFDGRSATVQDATVRLSGSGSASVRAVATLAARVSGSGSLRYWGSPQVEGSASGSGSIRHMGD